MATMPLLRSPALSSDSVLIQSTECASSFLSVVQSKAVGLVVGVVNPEP